MCVCVCVCVCACVCIYILAFMLNFKIYWDIDIRAMSRTMEYKGAYFV